MPGPQIPLCTKECCETDENDSVSALHQKPELSFEPDMQGPRRPRQAVIDEHTKILSGEGSISQEMEDPQTAQIFLIDDCCELDLRERGHHAAWLESQIHRTVISDELGNSEHWSSKDCSIVEEKLTVNKINDKRQHSEEPSAEANAHGRGVLVKLPPVVQYIFRTGIDNSYNTELNGVASPVVESSSVANTEILSVRVRDSRFLSVESVEVPFAAAPHCEGSCTYTTTNLNSQIFESWEMKASAVARPTLQARGDNGVELQIDEPLDSAYPVAAPPGSKSGSITAPSLKSHTVELHDLRDVAAAPQQALDDTFSPNEKFEKDSKADQTVDSTSRERVLVSEGVVKADSGTGPNSNIGDKPENAGISINPKAEVAAASSVPQLTRKQQLRIEQYKKFIAAKKARRYARKTAGQHAALDISNVDSSNLDISNKTPAPQIHQESATEGPPAEEGDVSSKSGNGPPPSKASSAHFPYRRRFQEVRQILLQNIDTAQSNIRPHAASIDADCDGLEASRHDEFNEVDDVMNGTTGPDDIILDSPPVEMVTDTRSTNAACRPVQRMNDAETENNHHGREQGEERPHVRPQSPYGQGIVPDSADDSNLTPSPMQIEVRSGATRGVNQASIDIDDDMQPRGVLRESDCDVDVDMEGSEEKVVPRSTKRKWKKVRRVVAGAIDDGRRMHEIEEPEWQWQGWSEESYAKPSVPPRLPPESSISSSKHQPLNVHAQHEDHEDHDQHSVRDSEQDTFSSFTLVDKERPSPPEDSMSVDGFGRTARGPRGRYPRRGGLNQNPNHHQIPFQSQNQNSNPCQYQYPNLNQNQHYHAPVHDQPVNVNVRFVSTAHRQHPGYQPQSRHSDPHRPMNGPTSNRRTSRNQPFPSIATSVEKCSGTGTVTNHPDPVVKPNSPAAPGINPNMMATITPQPTATANDNDNANTDTTRVQTTETSTIHNTEQVQNHNHSTPLAHTSNTHAHGDLDAQSPVKDESGMTSHDHSRPGAIPMSPAKNTTDPDHAKITMAANNVNASEAVTPNPLTPAPPTHNDRDRDRDVHRNRNRDKDRDRDRDQDSGVALPTPTNNHTNNSNNNHSRYREPGSGTGSGSVRTGKPKRRYPARLAAPPTPSHQEILPIVPDGTWDASTQPLSNITVPVSVLPSINLKKVPKYKFPQKHAELGTQSLNNAQAAANHVTGGNNPHATATCPPPLAQQAPAPNVSTRHAPAQPAPAPTTQAQPTSTQSAPPSAQPAPIQHVSAQSAPAQQTPMPEASLAPSASPDGPDKVQKPNTLAKNNGSGIWLPPHMRTPMPAIPIQPSRKAIPSATAKSAEADRKTRAGANGHSLKANSSACANADASSPKVNSLQTSATAIVPVNVDVSAAGAKSRVKYPSARSNTDLTTTKDKAADVKPRSLSNADVSPAKEKSKGANPVALSNADINTAMDKTSVAIPSTLLNAKEESAKGEPLESKPSATVDVNVASMKPGSLELDSSALIQPEVSSLPPQIPQLSKDKQPELAAPQSVRTPQVSLSNVSVNSQASFTGRRAVKKETLDFEHPLAGYDGGWGPAPVEWGDRPSFDHRDSWHVKSMHDWLKERAREALHNPLLLNTKDPHFQTGKALATGERAFGSPIDEGLHNAHLPDDEFTKVKYLETAELAVQKHQSKVRVERQLKQESKAERKAYRHAMREAAANYVPPPNPHTPDANIYIRPAEERDLKQIAEIYNHYIEHSVVVAERNPLTEQQWRGRWTDATESKYAFLVAVQMGSKGGGHNRRGNTETICGFAYADDFGDSGNAWRFTCELQCYVGHRILRMGVGKSLIDRMIGALDPRYIMRAAVRFEGGANAARYEAGGVRTVHKVVINIPYSPKDEETLKWQKEWLAQFHFEHVGTLPGIGRKFDKVVNLAMLMMETGSILPTGRY